MSVADHWLSIIGILPSPESVGPSGLHLRWSFPPSLGFPAKGFDLYRQEAKKKAPLDCTKFTDLATDEPVPNPLQRDGWALYVNETAELVGGGDQGLIVTAPGRLQIHFTEPVVRVRLQVSGVRQPIRTRAYDGGRLVSKSALAPPQSGLQELLVEASLITDIDLDLGFHALVDVCFMSLSAFCHSDWGQPLVRLPLVQTVAEALKRLPPGLRNHWASSTEVAIKQYGKKIEPMIAWLHLLQDPQSSQFENPGAPPDQLLLRLNSQPDAPIRSLAPQSLLLLASLDPNLAQILGLYWVNGFDIPGGPKRSVPYDYKIIGHWEDKDRCGVLLSLGEHEAPLPQTGKPASVEQLSGIHWQRKVPIGRVQLEWPSVSTSEPKDAIVRPMFYDITRQNVTLDESAPLTSGQPLFASSSTAAMQFMDRSALLGSYSVMTIPTLALFEYRYQIRGIDIFGQVGEEVISPSVQMRDLAAPSPPIRLTAQILQPGAPWRGLLSQSMLADPDRRTEAIVQLFGPGTEWIAQNYHSPAAVDLRFEYGAAQHRQAPDAGTCHIYWRSDSLLDAIPLELLSVTRVETSDTTEVRVDPGLDLQQFDGGWITNVAPLAVQTELPTSSRERIPIQRIATPDRIIIQGAWHPLPGQPYWLVADPYHRAGWSHTGRRVDIQQPLEGLVTLSSTLTVTGTVLVPEVDATSGSLLQPSTVRPPPASSGPNSTEILLDMELLDSDLFRGGSVRINGDAPLSILYSTAGISNAEDRSEQKRQAARIAIERDSALLPGEEVSVVLAAAEAREGEPTLFHATLADAYDSDDIPPGDLPGGYTRRGAGGELAWFERINGEVSLQRARIVSSATRQDGQTSFLIQSGHADLAQRLTGTTCRYYASYRIRFIIDVGSASTGDLALPVSMAQGFRQAFFTVLTADRGSSVQLDSSTHTVDFGPLSAPAQVTAVRPPLMPIPEAPIPCRADFSAGGTPGFATPSNRHGRATVCLKWRLPAAAGNEPIRFEIARALDTTIITAAKRAWLRGDLADAPQLAHESLTFSGPIRMEPPGQDPGSRTLTLRMEAATDGLSKRRLADGLIRQGEGFARVLQAIIDHENSRIDFRVEMTAGAFTFNQNAPQTFFTGVPQLDNQPIWSALRSNVELLRTLAAQQLRSALPLTLIDEAFGLVTGVPLHFDSSELFTYTDEIPGIGRNRYFYCARSVDAAENRSAWSAISVPFHQVDASPPAPPLLSAISGDRTVTLQWPVAAPDIIAYRLYRAESAQALASLAGQTPHRVIALDPPGPMLSLDAQSSTYNLIDTFGPQTRSSRTVSYRMIALRRQQTGVDSHVDIESLPGNTVTAKVLDLTPPAPPEWRFVRWVDSATDEEVTETAEDIAIDLGWQTPTSGAQCLLQRRTGDSGTWFNLIELQEGVHDPLTDTFQFTYRDQAVNPTLQYVYRVLIRNRAGRANLTFATQPLAKLEES